MIDGQQLFTLLADLICRRTLFLDLGLLLLLLFPQAVLLAELQLQLVTQLLQLLHLIFIILCDAVESFQTPEHIAEVICAHDQIHIHVRAHRGLFADHPFADDAVILLDLQTLFIDLRIERSDGRIKGGNAFFLQRDLRIQLLHERILLTCQRGDLIDVVANILDLLLQLADLLFHFLLSGRIRILELRAQICVLLCRLNGRTFFDPIFLIGKVFRMDLHWRDAAGKQEHRRDRRHDLPSVHHRLLTSLFFQNSPLLL